MNTETTIEQAAPTTDLDAEKGSPLVDAMSVRQLNLLRVGYLLVGGGLAVFKWPLLFQDRHESLAEGTVLCMLVGMSVLALLGLRYPQRMLPVLLFEVAWKLIWLAVVAVPAWTNHTLDDAMRTQVALVLWVVFVIPVIPWRQVLRRYVLASGDPWRSRAQDAQPRKAVEIRRSRAEGP